MQNERSKNMSIDDFKKKRIEEEYASLRDLSPLDYNKCAAMASYISNLIKDDKKSDLDVAAEVEAALVSCALRAVKAEDKIYELKNVLGVIMATDTLNKGRI